ncbi:ATP-binding protein [Streptacidiphilus rugosus]|uniref:ATP-binding protein n=1 Tax=Streptacidiphilus rugosus TaxID=405783 RepID=UPI000A0591E7|nr:ATP-binding protein [Streptacidiphilus rugosus]
MPVPQPSLSGIFRPDDEQPTFRFDVRPEATPAGVGGVRRLLRDALTAVRLDHDSPCLLLTELLTNALVHGCDPSVVVELRAGRLLIAVADRSPAQVERRAESPTSTNGRGILLVEALAEAWGVIPAGARGKAVWALMTAA